MHLAHIVNWTKLKIHKERPAIKEAELPNWKDALT